MLNLFDESVKIALDDGVRQHEVLKLEINLDMTGYYF